MKRKLLSLYLTEFQLIFCDNCVCPGFDNVASFTQHKLQWCQSSFRAYRLCNESQLSSLHDRGCDGFAWNFKNGLNLKVTYFTVFTAKLMPYQETYFFTASRILTTANRFMFQIYCTVLSSRPKVEKVSPDLSFIANILHNIRLTAWMEMLHND